jgi:hypothetical protein
MDSRCIQIISIVVGVAMFCAQTAKARDVDLKTAQMLVADGPRSKTEAVAAQMLQEEVQKRTGLRWEVSSKDDGRRPVIALATVAANELAGLTVPHRRGENLPEAGGIPR